MKLTKSKIKINKKMRSRWGFKHLLLCGFLFVFFAGVSFAQTGTNDKLFIDSIKKAASLAQKGQYQESLNLLEESLIFAKKNFGPDHENVAVSLINIGLIYKEMAEYDKAEKAYKEAISILKAKSGIGQNYLLTAYAKLGDVYAIQGKYDESQRYMELSLASSAGQKSVKLLPLMITQANK
ncbi:MAG: tetratricopeptide repeat protein [Candidatus Omnitrophota bacterium]